MADETGTKSWVSSCGKSAHTTANSFIQSIVDEDLGWFCPTNEGPSWVDKDSRVLPQHLKAAAGGGGC